MKLYVIVPLAALLAFAGFHWHAAEELRQTAVAKQAALEASRTTRLKAERDAQQQAMASLLAAQEQRKSDLAAREARELADRTARQAALDALDAARHRQTDLARQLDRLQQETAGEKKSITELEAAKKSLLYEQSYLRDLAVQADANIRSLTTVLEKLAAAQAALTAASGEQGRANAKPAAP
jgi:chromosome segregation ATPase